MDVTNRLDRRQALKAGAAVAGFALLASSVPALAQRAKGPAEVPVDELMKVGDLPDLVVGQDNAKVTIVEYASMTCGHCMAFHDLRSFPELKKKYVDTGKVRFIFREFPLDARAFAASMLARCAGSTEKSLGPDRRAVRTAGAVGVRAGEPDAEAVRNRQAGGLHAGKLRQVPDGPEAARPAHRRPHPRQRSVRRQRHPELLHQRQAPAGRARLIEEFDKVLEPLLAQG